MSNEPSAYRTRVIAPMAEHPPIAFGRPSNALTVSEGAGEKATHIVQRQPDETETHDRRKGAIDLPGGNRVPMPCRTNLGVDCLLSSLGARFQGPCGASESSFCDFWISTSPRSPFAITSSMPFGGQGNQSMYKRRHSTPCSPFVAQSQYQPFLLGSWHTCYTISVCLGGRSSTF